jgi:hypothetical protein
MGSPDTATPSSGSPAGTEYALPFDQGRHAGGGGSHHGGAGGSGGFTGGSGGGSGSGGGGTGATGGMDLFGAGILPAAVAGGPRGPHSREGGSSGGSASGKALHGASNAVGDTVRSARAVADSAAADAGKADGQVALIVLLLLAGGAALALGIRFVARRVPPAGAA